jgi:hypothetical protein
MAKQIESEKQKIFKALKYGLDLLDLKASDSTMGKVTEFVMKYHKIAPDELREVFDGYATDGGDEFISFNGRFISRLIREYHEEDIVSVLSKSEVGQEEKVFDYLALLFGVKLSRQENKILSECIISKYNLPLVKLIEICREYVVSDDKKQLYGALSVDYLSTVINNYLRSKKRKVFK